MQRVRVIWRHLRPFWRNFRRQQATWAGRAMTAAGLLFIIATFVGDPLWVWLATWLAWWGFGVIRLGQGIGAYRRMIHGDQAQTGGYVKGRWGR